MRDLGRIFEEAGCREVRTYIQSGNVVYRARASLGRQVPARVEAAIAARFGFRSPVVTRTAAEIETIVAANPFPEEAAADPKTVHVAFLKGRPRAAAVAALDPDRSPGDRFLVQGREVWIHFPNGAGRSKITNPWLDARLKTVSTSRNWRTVLALRDMLRE